MPSEQYLSIDYRLKIRLVASKSGVQAVNKQSSPQSKEF
jgi:hypothetical protein